MSKISADEYFLYLEYVLSLFDNFMLDKNF